MPSITIKNIPDDLSEELKVAAKTHRRSINNEVIMMLEEKLVPQKTSREELQKRARECFETNRELGIYVTQEELDEAINQGRPGWAKMLVVRLSLILISSPIFSSYA